MEKSSDAKWKMVSAHGLSVITILVVAVVFSFFWLMVQDMRTRELYASARKSEKEYVQHIIV